MRCTVVDIRGDYAYVKYVDTGIVSEVAIALLPWGVDVGAPLRVLTKLPDKRKLANVRAQQNPAPEIRGGVDIIKKQIPFADGR